ncbi:hypothetical protein FGO68_gene1997 [Halteria grandinella]|uniref:Uncharacterized protein n=1 Tax=Halteria grandinella TaxID=5974 RepID=A0A8J8NGI9_HALGN|nr:hypothetical protein FGO68_gene1997 [Halteria grandinella]
MPIKLGREKQGGDVQLDKSQINLTKTEPTAVKPLVITGGGAYQEAPPQARSGKHQQQAAERAPSMVKQGVMIVEGQAPQVPLVRHQANPSNEGGGAYQDQGEAQKKAASATYSSGFLVKTQAKASAVEGIDPRLLSGNNGFQITSATQQYHQRNASHLSTQQQRPQAVTYAQQQNNFNQNDAYKTFSILPTTSTKVPANHINFETQHNRQNSQLTQQSLLDTTYSNRRSSLGQQETVTQNPTNQSGLILVDQYSQAMRGTNVGGRKSDSRNARGGLMPKTTQQQLTGQQQQQAFKSFDNNNNAYNKSFQQSNLYGLSSAQTQGVSTQHNRANSIILNPQHNQGYVGQQVRTKSALGTSQTGFIINSEMSSTNKTRNAGVITSNTVANKYSSQKAGLRINPSSRNNGKISGGSFSLQNNGDYLQIAQMLQANNYTGAYTNNYQGKQSSTKLTHQRGPSNGPANPNMMVVGPQVHFQPRSPEKNKFITAANIQQHQKRVNLAQQRLTDQNFVMPTSNTVVPGKGQGFVMMQAQQQQMRSGNQLAVSQQRPINA